MKKLIYSAMSLLLIALVVGYWGCNQEQKQLTEPMLTDVLKTPGGGQAGTTLSATITAECFNYFDWSCVKTMDPGPYLITTIDPPTDITAIVTVTKGTQHVGVKGVICVTNGGDRPTEDLKVGAVLTRKSGGEQFSPFGVSIMGLESQHPVLAPRTSYCYTYEINYEYQAGYLYRVETDVTITNHSGSIGTPRGPQEKSDSYQPCQPSNNCITLTDIVGEPIKQTDPPGPVPGSWSFSVNPASYNVCASGDFIFTITVTNINAPQDCYSWNVNNYSLINGVPSCEAPFILDAGCRTDEGCTRTIGFWKTHAVTGLYGNNQDMVSDKLPISLGSLNVVVNTQVVSIMKREGVGGASNGILKLYSQLLAAKLNLAQNPPPPGDCIAEYIVAADNFLMTYDANSWVSLTKPQRNQVLQWQSIFDQYNNGLLCAEHCE